MNSTPTATLRSTWIWLALLLPNMMIAQTATMPTTLEHEGVARPALEVRLNIPKNTAKDYFKDFMDQQYDAHVNGLGFLQNKDLVSVEEATIPALHNKAMDLFVQFDAQNNGMVSLKLIGRDGYDLYFGPDHAPEVLARLATMLRQYKAFALEGHYTAVLKEETDRKQNLQREQERALRSITKNEDQIKDNLEDNEKLQKKTQDLRDEIDERSTRLDKLKQEITEIKVALP